ncbi:MAG: SPOR domain-containing protein [Planctomycetota bacterium]
MFTLPFLLAACASRPPREPAYVAAYRTRDFQGVLNLTQSPRDDRARLVRGMALYNTQRIDESESILRPLTSSRDDEVAGLAAATLGLIAWTGGDPDAADDLLTQAATQLRGIEQTRARRFLASLAGAPASGQPRYTVQIGAFSTNVRAQRSARAATDRGWPGPINVVPESRGSRTLYAVRVGRFTTKERAAELAETIGGFVKDTRAP